MPTATKWDFGVRVDVVGHASARWRGAKSRAEAERLNQALSEQRAQSVRAFVEQVIRRELPGVTLTPATSGPGQRPTGFQIGSKGVGSRQSPEPQGPDDNEAINRSVVLTLQRAITSTNTVVKSRPGRILARSKTWTLKVIFLDTIALGPGKGFIRVKIRNNHTGKEATYSTDLGGGGLDVDLVKKKLKLDPRDTVVGGEVAFSTDEALGFGDFHNQLIRVGKLEVSAGIGIPKTRWKVGVGTENMYLSFDPPNLGDGAQLLFFKSDFGFSKKISAGAFLMVGRLKMEGSNPGDWIDVLDYYDVTQKHTHDDADGMVVSFPTGKSALSDLTDKDRRQLEAYVTTWAKNTAVLAERLAVP
jgi:hypothetical protein